MDEEKKNVFKFVGVETLFITVVILVIAGILSYLNIIPLKSLFTSLSLNRPPKLVPAQIVGTACPVTFPLCRTAKNITIDKNPLLAYDLPDKSPVFAMDTILSYRSDVVTLEKTQVQSIRMSFIKDGKCYGVTYLAPQSIKQLTLTELPLAKGSQIATMSGEMLKIKEAPANLLISIQSKKLDPNLASKPAYEQCSILNTPPEKFGAYIKPDTKNFD